MNKDILRKAIELQKTIEDAKSELDCILDPIIPKLIDYVKKFKNKYEIKDGYDLEYLQIKDIEFKKNNISFKAYVDSNYEDDYDDICVGEFCHPYDILENPDEYVQKEILKCRAKIEAEKLLNESLKKAYELRRIEEEKSFLVSQANFFKVPVEQINPKTGYPNE